MSRQTHDDNLRQAQIERQQQLFEQARVAVRNHTPNQTRHEDSITPSIPNRRNSDHAAPQREENGQTPRNNEITEDNTSPRETPRKRKRRRTTPTGCTQKTT